jgi:large subunit ribosomal protein L28
MCDICGKGKQYGHNVSFSHRKTNKVWKPNLHTQSLKIDDTTVRVRICTSCMRTLAKYSREADQAVAAEAAQAPTESVTEKPEKKPVRKPSAKKAAAAKSAS